jgi:3-phosphoglycerate kinase
MVRGNILLVQNTRYEDIDGNKESSNDAELGKYWASLGDIFINDAFATSHRECASICGIASHIPSGIGFLVEKELKCLEETIKNPSHPFTVILGGAKVNDKIGVIEYLKDKADYILIGGGMSYTFLKAKGYNIGKSILDEENIDFCKKNNSKKIFIPIDYVVTDSIEKPNIIKTVDYKSIDSNDIGVDIGAKTIDLYKK